MSTFRLEGDLLHIGEGVIEIRTLIDWLADTGTLDRYEYIQMGSLEFDDAVQDEVDRALENLASSESSPQERLDNAVDELTYLDYDEDPYRYHDDNQHTGAVAYCPDPFCASAGRTETVIDILKGA